MIYVFTIWGKPERQQRPRLGRGHVYSPSSVAQNALGWQIKAAMIRNGWNMLEGPVDLNLRFFGSGKSDLSNLIKLFEDAANGILWKDDRQVLKISAAMVRKDNEPRTEVGVRESV